MKSLAFAIIISVSLLAFAQGLPFTSKQLKKVAKWNSCDKTEDCATTGFYHDNIRCPAMCSGGDLFVNKSNLQKFKDLIAPFESPSCPMAKCKDYSGKFELACVEHKCVNIKVLPATL